MGYTDYSPFKLEKATKDQLMLKIKYRHLIIRFVLFRILPWFLVLVMVFTHNAFIREMPGWFFVTWEIGILTLSVFLLFYKFESRIIFSKNEIELIYNALYLKQKRIVRFHSMDHVEVKKEQGGRSMTWVFYQKLKNGKRIRLFRIPIFLNENLTSRNNFIDALQKYCKVNVHLLN